MANGYRMGEVAEMAGITPDAMRYYERLGVLPRAPRTAGGLRHTGTAPILRSGRRVAMPQNAVATAKRGRTAPHPSLARPDAY